MGTWGPGNIENDTAAEHFQELCGSLIEQIEETVSDSTLMEPDEADSQIMICNLEILACLVEQMGRYEYGEIQDMLYPNVLPNPETIAEWKTKYLYIWDSYIDELDPNEDYKTNRRAVIVETFDRVERLSRNSASE